jgi:hypothetical protein
MYGDTEVIRGLGRELRRLGEEIRAEADRLGQRAGTTPWSGLAAEAMRSRVVDQVASLHHTARLHDDAAGALDEHAAEVDRIKALIAAVEATVRALVAAAEHRLAGLAAAVLPDQVDELLARFVPPPSGHRDWLTVDLPGLS